VLSSPRIAKGLSSIIIYFPLITSKPSAPRLVATNTYLPLCARPCHSGKSIHSIHKDKVYIHQRFGLYNSGGARPKLRISGFHYWVSHSNKVIKKTLETLNLIIKWDLGAFDLSQEN